MDGTPPLDEIWLLGVGIPPIFPSLMTFCVAVAFYCCLTVLLLPTTVKRGGKVEREGPSSAYGLAAGKFQG